MKHPKHTATGSTKQAVTVVPVLARSLMWPLLFASKLALERKSRQIELCDFLGGLFIGEFETLSRYYKDWRRVEEALRKDCGITRPVWFYRIELYHDLKNRKHPSRNKLFPFSSEVGELLQTASQIGNGKGELGATVRGSLEGLLLAISMRSDKPIYNDIATAGLLLERPDHE